MTKEDFIDLGDPTGLNWAEKYLGGYANLLDKLLDETFAKEFSNWQAELYARIELDALRVAQEVAQNTEDRNRLTAARFLHQTATAHKTPSAKRGRPSKEELAARLNEEVSLRKTTLADADRINLKVIHGGK